MASRNIFRDYVQQAQSGTRSQPVSPALQSVLERAAVAAGVTVRVTSGGQPPKGSGGARVGSTRHDNGNAADLQLIQNGRVLDFTKPADRAAYETFIRTAIANGVNGIGAATNYMGPSTIHIGFGPKGEVGGPVTVWGARGKSANAPDWLRAAASGPTAPKVAATTVASNMPMPRLRPATTPAGASALQFPSGAQIDQFAAVNPRPSPVPPTALPPTSRPEIANEVAYAPADQRASFPTDAVFSRTTPSGSVTVPNRQPYSIPAGPYGADQIIRAVLSNDPSAVQKAFDNVRGQVISQYGLIGAATQQDKASQEIASYFQGLGQESPQLGHAIHNAIQGNRAMLAALPEQSRPAITSGLAPYANEPTVQMPLPRLRPTQPTQAASLAPVSTFPARPAPAVSGNLPAQVRQIGQYVPNTPSARPQGSQPSTLGRIATAATSAGDWLRDVFAPPAKAALPSPTYNATAISQYRPMVQKPTASASPPSITQASFNDRFDAKPAVDYATGARAASGLQGYVPPPTVPLNLPNSAATMGIQPKPKAAAQTLQIAPPQTPVSKPLSILNPDWVEWEKATQANPELRPFLKAPTQWIPGAPAPITPIPKQKPLSVVVTPVAQQPPPPVNRVNGPTSQAARAGQPYYGTRSSSPSAGPTWSGTSPTSSGGANYNYRISSDGKTVSWTNSAGQTLTAARNV